MNRIEFLKKVIRYLLFGLLAAIVAISGRRVVSGIDCSACPGRGTCSGESDCSTFLSEKR